MKQPVSKSLPVPLREFNQLVETIYSYAADTGKPITHEEAKRRAHKDIKDAGYPGVEGGAITEARKMELRESVVQAWMATGLSEPAARIAAQVDESYKPAEMTTEQWAEFKW